MISSQHWKQNFYTIWSGQAVSLITSSILQMAMIWHLTAQNGSASVLSLATFVGFMPQAVLGPFIGVLIDRYDRKKIMIFSDLFVALVAIVLAVAAFFGGISVWMILVSLFLRSIGAAFHEPSLSAVTPLLVPEEELTRCAGYSQAISSIGFIISPALGALLYEHWHFSLILLLDVLGALIASLTILLVKIPRQKTDETVQANFLEELKLGYFALKKQTGLLHLLLIGAVFMLVFMPINALFPLLVKGYFLGTAMQYSIVEISFAVGMLLGGLLLGAWGGFKKKRYTMAFAIFVMGIALIISGILPKSGYVPFVILCSLMGFSSPLYAGTEAALYQSKIPPEYLGRVFSLSTSILSFTTPVGLLLSGQFADQIGIHRWFFVSGILILTLTIFVLILPSIRKLDGNNDTVENVNLE